MQHQEQGPQEPRLGLRRQLTLALGLLSALVAIVIAAVFWSASQSQQARHQADADRRMREIAGQVALQALLCRRYEKDFFLNLEDTRIQIDYLVQWQTAYAGLNQAIEAFSASAVTDDDQRQATAWRAESAQYNQGFTRVQQAITEQGIVTPQAANAAFTPFKEGIRMLTDSAVAAARRKAILARQAEAALDQTTAFTTRLTLAIGALALLLAIAWSLLFPARLMRPITQLHTAANHMAGGDLTARVPLDRHDELGALAHSFNHMATTIEQRTRDLEAEYVAASAAQAEAEAARAEIAAQLATITQQRAAIHELSVPILPITPTTLLMPLVGELDETRLELLRERALQALQQSSARHMILDITGVPVIDTQIAQKLVQMIRAARLLGAEVTLVGIRPEVAQAIVALDLRLYGMITSSTLQSGIAHALQH